MVNETTTRAAIEEEVAEMLARDLAHLSTADELEWHRVAQAHLTSAGSGRTFSNSPGKAETPLSRRVNEVGCEGR
jgi:hypothetical protein